MTSSVELTVPWGLQVPTGRMVNVDTVPNGKASNCICPSCKAGLVAKNQGTKKQHHFAHTADSKACEGWLHATAKYLLAQRIQDALDNAEPLPLAWECGKCRCRHEGNLLKKVSAVYLETPIKGAGIRPDISLEMGGTPPFTLIEVVVSHSPEPSVYEYCTASGCPLLLFRLDSSDDLDEIIRSPVLKPEAFGITVCSCRMCSYCKEVPICQDYHRYCEACQTCVTDVDDHSGMGAHDHCGYCGQVVEPSRGGYASHYCCYLGARYGIPVCHDKNGYTHRHCKKCHVRIDRTNRMGEFYEYCWRCYSIRGTFT